MEIVTTIVLQGVLEKGIIPKFEWKFYARKLYARFIYNNITHVYVYQPRAALFSVKYRM